MNNSGKIWFFATLALIVIAVAGIFLFKDRVPGAATQTAAGVEPATGSAGTAADGVPLNPRIAVIDVQALMKDSEAGKSIQLQMEQQAASFEAALKQQDDALKADQEKLVAERKGMSQEDFAKKAQEFQKKIVDERAEALKKRSDYSQAYNKAIAELEAEIVRIVASLADEKGYDIVVSRQNVVVVAKEYDVTADVMTALNAQKQTIDVNFEGAAE